MENQQPAGRRILRLAQVIAMTGYSRPALYAKMKAGDFPGSYQLGPRAVGWRSDEIDAWINSRARVARGAQVGRAKSNTKTTAAG